MCILKTDEGVLNIDECWQSPEDWSSNEPAEPCAEAVCISSEAPQHGDLCFVEDFARWNLTPFDHPYDDPHQTFFYVNALSDEYCKANMHWDLPSLDEMKESDQFCVGKPNFSGTLLDSDTITSHWKDGNPSGYGIICSEQDENFHIGGQALFCENSSTGEMEFKGLYSGNHVECEFDISVPWVLNDNNQIWNARKGALPVKAKPGIPNIFTRLSDHYDWIQSNMGSFDDTTDDNTAQPEEVVWEETTNDLPAGLVFASSSLDGSRSTLASSEAKLIGGQAPINPDNWKFMVHIGKQNTLTNLVYPAGKMVQGFCHGTIVGDRWILTNGDCCHNWNTGGPGAENTSAGLEIKLVNYILKRASFSHLSEI